MKIKDLVNAYPELVKLSKKSGLHHKLAYAISRNMHKVMTVIESFEAARISSLERHGGKLNQDTNQYEGYDTEAFAKDYKELAEMEVKTEDFTPYQAEVDWFEGSGFTGEEFYLLGWMIREA